MPGTDVLPSAVLDEEVPEIDDRGVEDASASELMAAYLLLTRVLSEKAGAATCERFLRVVLHKNFGEAAALILEKSLHTVHAVTEELDKQVADDMKSRGYRPVWIENPDDDTDGACVYLRDALDVIKRQLEKASSTQKNFYFQPCREQSTVSGEPVRRHPMSADLARDCLPHVIAEVMNGGSGAAWHPQQSFLCILQGYSDKNAMSLSTKSHVFYPFHLVVLNSRSADKDAMIKNGDTVFAYLSTDASWRPIPEGAVRMKAAPFRDPEDVKEGVEPRSFIDIENPADEAQARKIIFRSCLTAILSGVGKQALQGLRFCDADKVERVAHMAFGAYSEDAPELHLLTCTKQSGCARCHVSTKEMHVPGLIAKKRSVVETLAALHAIRGKNGPHRTAARDKILESGYSTTEPVLSGFPFTTIPGLDLYSLTRFDIMHAGPLGVFKHILEALYARLKSKELLSAFFVDAKHKFPKVMATTSKHILRECNAYFAQIDVESPAVGFSVDFARGKKKVVLDGFFTDKGIASMLHAKDYRIVQEVMPFVAALIDRYCSEGDGGGYPKPVMATVFTLYQEMDQALRRKDMEEPGFTDTDIAQVKRAINAFMTHTLDVLADFQKSGFCVGKWHAYSHVTADIEALGMITGFDMSMFEASHPLYKTAGRGTSGRQRSATDETTTVLARNECSIAFISRNAQSSNSGEIIRKLVYKADKISARPTLAGLEAVITDTAVLPVNGVNASWRQLQAITESRCKGEDEVVAVHMTQTRGKGRLGIRAFSGQLPDPEHAHRALQIVLLKALAATGSPGSPPANLTSHDRKILTDSIYVTVVKTARLAGVSTPVLSDVNDFGEVHVHDSGFRIQQRAISAASFSHSKKVFQDTVLVSGGKLERALSHDDDHETTADAAVEPEQLNMWFAKSLAFIRIRAESGPLADVAHQEFAIVRYYEVIPKSEVVAIDVAVGCVRLRLAVDDSEPWIDVVPATSIRGRVHVIKAAKPMARPARMQDSSAPDWKDETFYVNRFKVSNYASNYNIWHVVEE